MRSNTRNVSRTNTQKGSRINTQKGLDLGANYEAVQTMGFQEIGRPTNGVPRDRASKQLASKREAVQPIGFQER
jgi:hypothetical protein